MTITFPFKTSFFKYMSSAVFSKFIHGNIAAYKEIKTCTSIYGGVFFLTTSRNEKKTKNMAMSSCHFQ